MTMRATRDALESPWETVWIVDEAEPECGAQPTITQRDTSAALAEIEATEQRIEALEAVAEAARDLVTLVRIGFLVTHKGQRSSVATVKNERLQALLVEILRAEDTDAALARLAETQNGQTPGGGERVETAADNASLTPCEGEPVPAPGACPCCIIHGCSEDCA